MEIINVKQQNKEELQQDLLTKVLRKVNGKDCSARMTFSVTSLGLNFGSF